MSISIFLARVIGFYFVIVGAFYFLRRDYIKTVINDLFAHAAMSVIGGTVALIIGLLIVITHNFWVFDWAVVITIVGYLSLIKGIWLLFFPESGKNFARRLISGQGHLIFGAILILIGIFLLVMGYAPV